MRVGGGSGESERGTTLCKMRRGRCWNFRGAGLTMVVGVEEATQLGSLVSRAP